jgi:hypothetical protein
MEEWMAFLETFSPYILLQLPWPTTGQGPAVQAEFEAQWGHLRAGCLYFLRYHDGQHTKDRIDEAGDHLLSYAKLAEKVRLMRGVMCQLIMC